MKKILILGYGKLGQVFYQLFHSRYKIRGIKRSPVEDDPCPVILTNIQSEDTRLHLSWADVIIFSPSSGGGNQEQFKETYLDNIKATIQSLKSGSPETKQFILIGSTGVYPRIKGKTWKEDSIIPIETHRQAILLQTEQVAIQSRHLCVILRCGGLYGPGRGNFSWILKKGRLQSSDLTDQFFPVVHQEDVCAVIDQLIQDREISGIFNLVDDSGLRKRDLFKMVSEETGVRILNTGPAPPVDDRKIENSKVKQALGFRFQHSVNRKFLKEHLMPKDRPA